MSLVNRHYLRGARKRAGLTQEEVAYLLSISRSNISQVENLQRPIPLRMLLAYCLLFDCDPVVLCPDLACDIAKQTAQRIDRLLDELQPVITRVAANKRDTLAAIRQRCQ